MKIFQIQLVRIVFRGQTMQMQLRICARGVAHCSAQHLRMPRLAPCADSHFPAAAGLSRSVR